MNELKNMVEASENDIVLVTGRDLKEAAEESRLKSNARERVEARLSQNGLVALPEVPWDQTEKVYLAASSKAAHLLFQAYEAPSEMNLHRITGSLEGAGEVVGKQDALKEAKDIIEELGEIIQRASGEGDRQQQEPGTAAQG